MMPHKLFILMGIVVFFGACTSTEKSEKTTASGKADFKRLDTTLYFAGYWLSEAYFDDIRRRQSPSKAQEGSEECFIVMPDRTRRQTMMVWNFHEAGEQAVVLKNADKYQLYETSEDSIGRYLKDIVAVAPDKMKIGQKTFVKIAAYAPPNETNHPLILEEILFKGKYLADGGQPVEFKNNGQVTGLKSYQYYQPAIDYIGPGMQVDQVSMGTSETKKERLAFRFSQDTLRLYELRCVEYDEASKECGLADYGRLKHTLVRTK